LAAAAATNATQRLLNPDGEDERPNLPIVLLRQICATYDRIDISSFSPNQAKSAPLRLQRQVNRNQERAAGSGTRGGEVQLRISNLRCDLRGGDPSAPPISPLEQQPQMK
jgi:hypothetical protein